VICFLFSVAFFNGLFTVRFAGARQDLAPAFFFESWLAPSSSFFLEFPPDVGSHRNRLSRSKRCRTSFPPSPEALMLFFAGRALIFFSTYRHTSFPQSLGFFPRRPKPEPRLDLPLVYPLVRTNSSVRFLTPPLDPPSSTSFF